MLDPGKRAKVGRRLIAPIAIALLVASAMACTLFANLDGLQNGDVDAGSDASIDAMAPDAADATAPSDAGPLVDAALTPIDFVQVNANYFAEDAGVAAVTMLPVKPGNSLVVAVWIGDTGVTPMVTDDKGDAFSAVVGPYGSAHGVADYVFASINVTGNAQTITTTLSKHDAFEVYALEYSGIGSFDVGISNLIDGAGTLHSGFVQTKVPNELLFAFSEDGEVTNGAGFIARSTFVGDLVEDQLAGAPGPYEATAGLTDEGEIVVAAFMGK